MLYPDNIYFVTYLLHNVSILGNLISPAVVVTNSGVC